MSSLILLRLCDKAFFTEWGCQPHSQPPIDPVGPKFSVCSMSLNWLVPIKAPGTRFTPLHVSAVKDIAQGSWRGHACTGFGRNKWHFLSFASKLCTLRATFYPFGAPHGWSSNQITLPIIGIHRSSSLDSPGTQTRASGGRIAGWLMSMCRGVSYLSGGEMSIKLVCIFTAERVPACSWRGMYLLQDVC